jgi:serine/threonine-protein kinase
MKLTSTFCLLLVSWAIAAAAAEGKPDGAALAAQVKEILRNRCLECHGGSATQEGIKVLDHGLLIEKEVVLAGKPDDSPLFRSVIEADEDVRMPKGSPALPATEVAAIREWILAEAPPFPADVAIPSETRKDAGLQQLVGVDYVLKQILQHQNKLPTPGERRAVRYFSCNHLLARGATQEELEIQKDALNKAVNHLSREPRIVPVTVVDPAGTIFALDIRQVGWDKLPFQIVEKGQLGQKANVNFFDLVLLEYPYGVIYEDSETFDAIVRDYLNPAGTIRPIPYIRSDWFCSVATQPPLYHDLLQLPHDLPTLEKELGVDVQKNIDDHVVKRAGMQVSGVSRNNRAVERHPGPHGMYWKSIDYATSKGQENLFTDPVHLQGTGGEMIFTLPNGLQAYYLATGKGERLDAAPTDIVTDKFAEDKTVRNGLACMRCHDEGMKNFEDTIRPAIQALPGSGGIDKRTVLALYPPQAEMNAHLKHDREQFMAALNKALGKPQVREPLIPVSQRFLDAPLQLASAAGELGLADAADLKSIFKSPAFTALGLVPLANRGVVRRDMWEDYYDQTVRSLGLGIPVVPFDGLTRADYQPMGGEINVSLATTKKNNVFAPGDELAILVKNNGDRPIFLELIGAGTKGQKVVIATGKVVAGGEFRHPEKGAIKVQPSLGKEQIMLYASETEFPPAKILRGTNLADRALHDFYGCDTSAGGLKVKLDPARIVKRTIVIETK